MEAPCSALDINNESLPVCLCLSVVQPGHSFAGPSTALMTYLNTAVNIHGTQMLNPDYLGDPLPCLPVPP